MGAIEIQVFVSLVVILGAAFVALICDFLKGSNEQLREANIVMRVREDERDKRDDLVEKVQQQTIEVVAKVQGALAGRTVAAPQSAARAQQPPATAPQPAPAPLVTPVADARELFERAQQERSSRGRRGNRRAESKSSAPPPTEQVASWAQDIVIRKHQEAEPATSPMAEPEPAAAAPAPVAPLPLAIPVATAHLQQQEFGGQESPAPPAAVEPAGIKVPMAETSPLPLAPVQAAAAPAVPAYSNLAASHSDEITARTEPVRPEPTPAMVEEQQRLAAQVPVTTNSSAVAPVVEVAAVESESVFPRAAQPELVCRLAEAGSVAAAPGQPAAATAAPVTIDAAALVAEAQCSLPVSALHSEVPVFEIAPPVSEPEVAEAAPVAEILPGEEAFETLEAVVPEGVPVAEVVEAIEAMAPEAPAEEIAEVTAVEQLPVTIEEPVAEAAPISEFVEAVEAAFVEAPVEEVVEPAAVEQVIETVETPVMDAALVPEVVEPAPVEAPVAQATLVDRIVKAALVEQGIETAEATPIETVAEVVTVETVDEPVADATLVGQIIAAAAVPPTVETLESPAVEVTPMESEAAVSAPTPDYSLLDDTPVYAEIPTTPRLAEPEPEPVAETVNEPVAEAEPLFTPTVVEGAPEEEIQVVRIRVISDDDVMPVSEFIDTPISLDEFAAEPPAAVEPEPVAEPEPVVAAEVEPEPAASWEEVLAAMAAETQRDLEPMAEAPVEPEFVAEVLAEPVAAAEVLPEPVAASEVPASDAVDEPSIWMPGAEPATWDLQPASSMEAPAPMAEPEPEPEPAVAEASNFTLPASNDPFSFRPSMPQPVAEAPAPAMPRGEMRPKVVEMRAAAQARPEPEVPAVPTLELPGGFHEPNALARLLEDEIPFAGLVIAVSVVDYVRLMADQGKPAIEQIMGSVTRLVMSLTREQDFACRIAEDEFILIFAGETGAAAKRRTQLVSERLWDYQLRSLGSVSIIFSWGASESAMQPIVHAVENAREQMLETRRNRRNLTGVSRRFGRHAANS